MTLEIPFKPDHSDRLTVLQLNFNSSKLLTASIDHKVVVYNHDRKTGQTELLDSFTAHDAEVRDARWFDITTGTHFVTIGNDLTMRIWSEDTSQAPTHGRRFRRVATIKSVQLVPFVSVDVKTVGTNTYIVVIDRQGLLSLYEPTNPDEFNEWTLVDQFYVYNPIPNRGDHSSFRVRFDQNVFPLPYTTSRSNDSGQLGIAVSAMNEAKLYRSTADPDIIASYTSSPSTPGIGRGASHRLLLFEVLRIQPSPSSQIPPSGTLIRDVALCDSNYIITDMIATASINGTVAVYEISLQRSNTSTGTSKQTNSRPTTQPQQSNLTSALHPTTTSSSSNTSVQVDARANHPFPYSHHATPISVLQNAHVDAWSVQWNMEGRTLLSTGSDGTVKLWKRVIDRAGVPGAFVLIAEQAGEEDDSSADDTDEEDEEDAGRTITH